MSEQSCGSDIKSETLAPARALSAERALRASEGFRNRIQGAGAGSARDPDEIGGSWARGAIEAATAGVLTRSAKLRGLAAEILAEGSRLPAHELAAPFGWLAAGFEIAAGSPKAAEELARLLATQKAPRLYRALEEAKQRQTHQERAELESFALAQGLVAKLGAGRAPKDESGPRS